MALHLTRKHFDIEAFDFDVSAMLEQAQLIHKLCNQPANKTEEWINGIREILAFQLEDGSFSVTDNYHMPSDARVDFIYHPSYDCCQALIKALLVLSKSVDNTLSDKGAATGSRNYDASLSIELIPRIEQALRSGLSFCCGRNLEGHGIEGLSDQIETMNGFIAAGAVELMKSNRALCPDFFNLIERIAESYSSRLRVADVYDGWQGCHADEYAMIANAFGLPTGIAIFVYGTLMMGMRNAGHVEHLPHLGQAWLNGYTLYNLGRYPGIRKSNKIAHRNNVVFGELIEVEFDDLRKINELEGEGTLYKLTKVKVDTHMGPKDALTYVYLHDVEPNAEIPPFLQPYSNYVRRRSELVWYVAYGSNLKYERFMHYLQGGRCRFNGRTYPGCLNSAAPIAIMPLEIPHDIYFGNNSGSWNGGVAFLDPSKPGHTYGRAYLITLEQYEELRAMEGSSASWYPDEITLGEYADIPVRTFTNAADRPRRDPSESYLAVLREGIEETFPQLDVESVDAYLSSALSR